MTKTVWPRPLLYRRLAPWLADLGVSRPVKAWIIGMEDDLSSITRTVAARAAHGARSASHMELKLYATLLDSHGSSAEVERRAEEATHDEHWPELEVDLALSEPGEQVDLAAVHSRSAGHWCWQRACERVRPGGRLLLDKVPSKPPAGMIDLDGSGLLFEKQTRSGGGSPSGLTQVRQDRLVNDHMALARSLARRFEGRGEATEELRQVASAALVSCSRRFDPERGVAFSSYATGSILGELKRHFRDRAWGMRVGRSTQETYLEVNKARETLSQRNGRSPTIAEIAVDIGSTEEKVLEAMDAERGYWLASLDAPREDTGEAIELASIDEGFDRALNRHELERLLPELSPRELIILERRFFRGWTQEQIADDIGVSQMQVSRLLARTLEELRTGFRESDGVATPADG
ncbi:MAG TPA: sigma-70 family RNA polymerase sigma factor [Acidimicrobiales bacterium]|nr:sigma-70 family RNA polymerase sigma factor [Acidimicrobiales bacterium]